MCASVLVFPASKICTDPRFGAPQRYHLHESVPQRAMVQELVGHRDVKTTMIYTHVLNRGGHGVQSPADRLLAGPPQGC